MNEIKIEIEEDERLPKDHPEREKFKKFLDWMMSTGAGF
jgi:hypothetical protein